MTARTIRWLGLLAVAPAQSWVLLTLTLLPIPMSYEGGAFTFHEPRGGTEIYFKSSYRAVTWASPFVLPLNLSSESWHYWTPYRDRRIEYLRHELAGFLPALAVLAGL